MYLDTDVFGVFWFYCLKVVYKYDKKCCEGIYLIEYLGL